MLPEYGETYVREHERGGIESNNPGHKIIFKEGRSVDRAKKAKPGRYTPPKARRN